MKREIPAQVFRFWAACFRERKLQDEYADELTDFLEFAANATEFDEAMQRAYEDQRPKHERIMN